MPGGPGNLSWQMPPRADDILRKQKDQTRSQREQAAGNILQGAQVGAGGILINNGGSLTIQGTGTFNTNGAITTSGAFSAGTTVTAGGNITSTGGSISAAGNVTASGGITATGTLTGGALSVSGGIAGASLSCGGGITSSAGSVYSQGAMQSPGSRATVVTSGYVNAFLDVNGVLGYQPSTIRLKKDLQPIPDSLLAATLKLPTHMGRYKTETTAAPLTPFLIAEDVQAAGFGTSVVPLDDGGEPVAINTQNLFPVLVELIKRQDAQIKALDARVRTLETNRRK